MTDFARALEWFTAFFGRPADEIIGYEALWEVSETAWLFVAEQPDRAGGALRLSESGREPSAAIVRPFGGDGCRGKSGGGGKPLSWDSWQTRN